MHETSPSSASVASRSVLRWSLIPFLRKLITDKADASRRNVGYRRPSFKRREFGGARARVLVWRLAETIFLVI